MNVLVTGAAGFIGYTLALRLLERGDAVFGVDNLNDYYDVSLKEARLARLRAPPRLRVPEARRGRPRRDGAALRRPAASTPSCISRRRPACATRWRIRRPTSIPTWSASATCWKACGTSGVGHLVFASSSSVYGANTRLPFSEHDNVDHPLSLYAATKKANELMAHSYAHLYGMPCTGLRFFTVYGPWGRPDMALFKFTRGILRGHADHGVQRRRHGARLHLRRRYRRGRRARHRPAGGAGSGVARRRARSGDELRALPDLQHRQQPAGQPDALHRGAGAVPGPQGGSCRCCRCSPATCRRRWPT